jgi:hypothetical protein
MVDEKSGLGPKERDAILKDYAAYRSEYAQYKVDRDNTATLDAAAPTQAAAKEAAPVPDPVEPTTTPEPEDLGVRGGLDAEASIASTTVVDIDSDREDSSLDGDDSSPEVSQVGGGIDEDKDKDAIDIEMVKLGEDKKDESFADLMDRIANGAKGGNTAKSGNPADKYKVDDEKTDYKPKSLKPGGP